MPSFFTSQAAWKIARTCISVHSRKVIASRQPRCPRASDSIRGAGSPWRATRRSPIPYRGRPPGRSVARCAEGTRVAAGRGCCCRQAVQLAENPFEVGLLQRQQLLERLPSPGLVARQNHFADAKDAILGKEHVLCPAETDAGRAEEPRHASVVRCIGIRANAEGADLVGPSEEAVKSRNVSD